jgi:hypothetical protein
MKSHDASTNRLQPCISQLTVLQQADLLLGNDLKTNNKTTFAARQQLLLGNAFANKHVLTGAIGVQKQKVFLRGPR